MTAAALPQLRARGVGELLDQAIRLYRKNFLKFVGIIAVIQIPITLFQLLLSVLAYSGFLINEFGNLGQEDSALPPELLGVTSLLGFGGSFVIGLVGVILVQGVATAALTRAIAGSYVGETVDIIEAYRKIGSVWLSLILTLLLVLVLAVGVMIWAVVPCVGWITGLGMFAFLWMVILPLLVPVVIVEGQVSFEAIRRAWELARRRFWWVLGFRFVLFLFSKLVIQGPVTLMSTLFYFVLGVQLQASGWVIILQTVFQSVMELALTLLYLPLQLTAVALLYFDLRIRTEGFDLALLAQGGTGELSQFSELAVGVPRPEPGSWVTMTEMGYFALMEVGVMGLYFILIFLVMSLFFAVGAASGF
jgi:hypothetical protein